MNISNQLLCSCFPAVHLAHQFQHLVAFFIKHIINQRYRHHRNPCFLLQEFSRFLVCCRHNHLRSHFDDFFIIGLAVIAGQRQISKNFPIDIAKRLGHFRISLIFFHANYQIGCLHITGKAETPHAHANNGFYLLGNRHLPSGCIHHNSGICFFRFLRRLCFGCFRFGLLGRFKAFRCFLIFFVLPGGRRCLGFCRFFIISAGTAK